MSDETPQPETLQEAATDLYRDLLRDFALWYSDTLDPLNMDDRQAALEAAEAFLAERIPY